MHQPDACSNYSIYAQNKEGSGNIDALENCFCLVQVNVFGNAIPDVSLLREKDIIVNYDPTAAAATE